MEIVKHKSRKPILPEPEDIVEQLGLKLVKLGGDSLKKSGIHLNLLKQSGILSGPSRDVNLIRRTVEAISQLLREEGLESILAKTLEMDQFSLKNDNLADACTVTSVIWTNAAIMHARLDEAKLPILQNVPALKSAVAEPNPASGIAAAWQKVLIKDYVPIFEVAQQLLIKVAFENRIGVFQALRRMANDAVEIADTYADLGMDHAGELFNKVMGNQRSDGAFFTRPIAASLLSELALQATGETNWSDPDVWERLRCFDPACGSGTLLVAMITAIKMRIEKYGGNKQDSLKFHQLAVEDLMMGADINPVSLQIAGCQLTLGNVHVHYKNINLWSMEYSGGKNNVKTGSPEILVDSNFWVNKPDEIELDYHDDASSQLEMHRRTPSSNQLHSNNEIVGRLINKPPQIIMMNPPYTPWKDIGSKFEKNQQKSVRDRLGTIWDSISNKEEMLRMKKTSIAPLFETIGIELTHRSHGVIALVRPLVFVTMASAKNQRAILAQKIHIDYILVCHDPANINMSWDTSINECLIVGKYDKNKMDVPTKFISIDRMPSSPEESHELISAIFSGVPFDGSVFDWSYDHMKNGNWSPGAFREANLAGLLSKLITNNININQNWGGGGMEGYKIRYLEVLLTSKLT